MARMKFEMWVYQSKPGESVNGYMSRFTDGRGIYTDSWWSSPPSSIDHVSPSYLRNPHRHPNAHDRHADFIKSRYKEEISRLMPQAIESTESHNEVEAVKGLGQAL